MISCAEFIPAYSELFSFLDENFGGHKEVERFWEYLFKPTGKGIPLINYAKKDGLRGCFNYWKKTLKEEAASTTRYLNENKGFIFAEMHYCPSKGRLLEYQKEIGLVPYYDYCGHCDYYRAHLEKVGLTWIRNHAYVDKAQCRSLIIDPKKFKGIIEIDENTEKFEISAEGAEYFHPDFHSSLNMGIEYLGTNYGIENLKKFFKRFVKNVYVKTIEEAKLNPLVAIERRIKNTYELEKATNVLTTTLSKDKLVVSIDYCPAVKHLTDTKRKVSEFFEYSTTFVMQALAEEVGVEFNMDYYDTLTGKATYSFFAK